MKTLKLVKNAPGREQYLADVNNSKHQIALTRLRLSAHQLEIEAGRWGRHSDISAENRLCTLCHLEGDNSVEDEVHFLVRCPVYQKLRENLLPQLVLLDRNMTDEQKFVEIMTNFEVKNIARFVYLAFEERKIKLDVLSTLKDLVSSTEILLKKEKNTPDPGKPNTFQIKWCSSDGMKLTLSRV